MVRLDRGPNGPLYDDFIAAYKKYPKLDNIMEKIRAKPTNEDDSFLFLAGYPFHIANGLLYNRRVDGIFAMCIPHGMVGTILVTEHDEQHHYGRDRMLYELQNLAINNKTTMVKRYIKHCPSCAVNSTDYSMPPRDYQPIRPEDPLPMRVISLDFITKLPVISAEDSP